MQVPIFPHLPPKKLGALLGEGQPCGDVGLMIHVSDNDFIPLSQGLANRKADQADERSRVHSEGNLARVARMHQHRHTLPCALDARIHFHALAAPRGDGLRPELFALFERAQRSISLISR